FKRRPLLAAYGRSHLTVSGDAADLTSMRISRIFLRTFFCGHRAPTWRRPPIPLLPPPAQPPRRKADRQTVCKTLFLRIKRLGRPSGLGGRAQSPPPSL